MDLPELCGALEAGPLGSPSSPEPFSLPSFSSLASDLVVNETSISLASDSFEGQLPMNESTLGFLGRTR